MPGAVKGEAGRTQQPAVRLVVKELCAGARKFSRSSCFSRLLARGRYLHVSTYTSSRAAREGIMNYRLFARAREKGREQTSCCCCCTRGPGHVVRAFGSASIRPAVFAPATITKRLARLTMTCRRRMLLFFSIRHVR